MTLLRTVGNLVWLVVVGWALALAHVVAGVLACVLIVTIPFGIASFRLALYALWPFGRTVIDRPDAGVASLLGNVLWFLVAGWWLALAHLAAAAGWFLTIIGIPFGIAAVKLAVLSLFPLGKEIVPVDRFAER
jgi:uncharacterized membrane protein YccF (DUF307 family)